jgi:hypothetical protein
VTGVFNFEWPISMGRSLAGLPLEIKNQNLTEESGWSVPT